MPGDRSRGAASSPSSELCLSPGRETGMAAPHPRSLSFPVSPPAAPSPGGASISLWTVVAAVQALERGLDAHAERLVSLERRAGTTERKHLECEKTVVEFGNQLESKLAALGALVREYGQLQRRLESMESLLRNRNFCIFQLPCGDQVSKTPAVFFSAQDWDRLEDWQKELYRNVLRARSEALADDTISKPVLSQLQGGEAPGDGDKGTLTEIPAEPECLLVRLDGTSQDSREAAQCPTGQENLEGRRVLAEPGPADHGIPELSLVGAVKQEEELCEEEQEAMEGAELTELSVVPADEVIMFKVEQLDSEECPQNSEPPRTLTGEPEELLLQSASEVLPCQYSSPGQQGHQSTGEMVPSAPEDEELCEIQAVTFYGQNCPNKRPHSCTACGKGFCLRRMLMTRQEGHSSGSAVSQCSSEHAEDEEGFLHQQIHVEEGTHVPTEMFEQNQGGRAHTSIPDQEDSSPRCITSSHKPGQSSHPRGRPYKCAKCQECFSQKKSLIIHRRTHSGRGGEVLWCSSCGKTFSHPSSLIRHLRIHTGERPYPCSQCPKRFTQKQHLLQHEKIHQRAGSGARGAGKALLLS